MTEEQIKQNAEAYALKKTLTSTDSFHGMVEHYSAGAHSRDEEIESKNNTIKELGQQCGKQLLEILDLKNELDRLRNPWINASKQLPPEDKEGSNLSIDCLVMAGDGNSFFYVIAWYDYSGKYWYEKYDFDQTHLDGNKVYYWMELPKCNHIETEGGDK